MSDPAEVPSAASAAASAMDAPDASAFSTAVARSGVDPMLTSATACPCTATPTIAQSIARLVNFWNDRVAVRHRTADRAAVPDLRVAHPARRKGEQRHVGPQQSRVLHILVPGHRA